MPALLLKFLLAFAAADTACAESSYRYDDGQVVLQVVRNRAESKWARYSGGLANALFSPAQHAHWCRAPITAKHMQIGMAFVMGTLTTPAWAKKALWYCNREKPGTCEKRCQNGCAKLGKVLHTYYGNPTRVQVGEAASIWTPTDAPSL